MRFPYPKWIEQMPDGEDKDRAKNRFVLRLCCLYAHPHGHIHDLARMLGMNPMTLKTQVQSRKVFATRETIDSIRKVLGPEFEPPDFNAL